MDVELSARECIGSKPQAVAADKPCRVFDTTLRWKQPRVKNESTSLRGKAVAAFGCRLALSIKVSANGQP